MHLRSAIAITVLLRGAAAHGQAPAASERLDGPDIALSWEAPRECPDGAALVARTSARIGRAVTVAPMSATRVRGELIATPGGAFQMHLAVTTRDGEAARTLVSVACERLVDVAALVVALALEPLAVAAALRLPQRAAVAIVPARERPTPPWFVRVAAVGDLGSFSGPGGGGQLAFGAGGTRWRGEIGVMAFVPVEVAAGVRDTLVRFGPLIVGQVRACGTPVVGRLDLGLCGAVDLGWISAAGAGNAVFDRPTSGAPWFAATMGLELAWHVSPRFALRAALDVGAAIIAPRFYVSGCAPCELGPWPLFARAALGPELHFP